MILSLKNISKSFLSAGSNLTVLDNVSFILEDSATCAIVGPSGSGKTTLLSLCAGLELPSSGAICFGNEVLTDLSEDERARIRSADVGFVFQAFQLLPTLTAIENIMVPLELLGKKNSREKARELLNRVGLSERETHYPSQLSGGEQQRVAIARAFINQPKILFADEPTGNLDAKNGDMISELLFSLNRESGTSLLVATHDINLASQFERTIGLQRGQVISDVQRSES